MSPFPYIANSLHCEGVALAEIARRFGTPCYVYSHRFLVAQLKKFQQAFCDIDHLICFSMKANSCGAILRTLIQGGCGMDVVSGGELARALAAGCDPQKIVFSGVGKTQDEMAQALACGILQFNVESAEELVALQGVAARLNCVAPVALRVNPDVDAKTHPYIATGLKHNKFGIPAHEALALYRALKASKHVCCVGLDCHIGSQLTQVAPFVAVAKKLREMVLHLRREGISLEHLDIGGGLGVTYCDEKPPTPQEYAEAVLPELRDLQVQLILEPGRFLVAESGALLTRVLYHKPGEDKSFVIVDAGMNDLIRPALYEAYQEILPVRREDSRPDVCVDVVGPVCETGDFFARGRSLARVVGGEYLAILGAGAYGSAMSSSYNSRPPCAEVLVKEDEVFLIRARGEVADLTRREMIPNFLQGV